MEMNEADKISDQELAGLLKAGNERAYTEIYDRYNGPLYIFAYKRLHNREEVQDLLHELFYKLWVDRKNFPETVNLAGYLYTAVRNRIINSLTKQKVAERHIDSFSNYLSQHAVPTADQELRSKQLQEFIDAEIANLPARTRQVFELSRKMHLNKKEIALTLEISEETVKSHIHTALKTLKKRLGPLFFMLF